MTVLKCSTAVRPLLLTVLLLGAEPAVSLAQDELLTFTVHNTHSAAVDLIWIDETGEATSYGTILPGQSVDQQSYEGTPWQLHVNGRAVGFFNASARVPNVDVASVVSAAAMPPVPQPGAQVRTHWQGTADPRFTGFRGSYRLQDRVWHKFDENGRPTGEAYAGEAMADGAVRLTPLNGDGSHFITLTDRSSSHGRIDAAGNVTAVGGGEGRWVQGGAGPNVAMPTKGGPNAGGGGVPASNTLWRADPGGAFSGSFQRAADGTWTQYDRNGEPMAPPHTARVGQDGAVVLTGPDGKEAFTLTGDSAIETQYYSVGGAPGTEERSRQVMLARGRWANGGAAGGPDAGMPAAPQAAGGPARNLWMADPGSPTGFSGGFLQEAGTWFQVDADLNATGQRFSGEWEADGALRLTSLTGGSSIRLRDGAGEVIRSAGPGREAAVSLANGRWRE